MTKPDVRNAFDVVVSLIEAIRTAGEIPAGTLYAAICDKVPITVFEPAIRTIVRTGLVERRGHLLRWTGPEIEG